MTGLVRAVMSRGGERPLQAGPALPRAGPSVPHHAVGSLHAPHEPRNAASRKPALTDMRTGAVPAAGRGPGPLSLTPLRTRRPCAPPSPLTLSAGTIPAWGGSERPPSLGTPTHLSVQGQGKGAEPDAPGGSSRQRPLLGGRSTEGSELRGSFAGEGPAPCGPRSQQCTGLLHQALLGRGLGG